jgi:hypothetical protein
MAFYDWGTEPESYWEKIKKQSRGYDPVSGDYSFMKAGGEEIAGYKEGAKNIINALRSPDYWSAVKENIPEAISGLSRVPPGILGFPADLVNMGLEGIDATYNKATDSTGRHLSSDYPFLGHKNLEEGFGYPERSGSPTEFWSEMSGYLLPFTGKNLYKAEEVAKQVLKENVPKVVESVVPKVLREPITGLNVVPESSTFSTFRRIKKGKDEGQVVGAPRGVKSEQDYDNLVNQYIDRIMLALDEGIKPGYFYKDAEKTYKGLTETPEDALRANVLSSVYSPNTPVTDEFGYMVKALQQHGLDEPIKSGRFPTKTKERAETVLAGEFPLESLGPKVEPYVRSKGGLSDDIAPNDIWEVRSLFGKYKTDDAGNILKNKQGKPVERETPTEAQTRFMHSMRDDVVGRLKEQGINLSAAEAQELNWAAVKMLQEGKSAPDILKFDTVGGAVPKFRTLLNWETVPGKKAEHMTGPYDKDAYNKSVADILRSDQGKDEIVAALGGGGELQLPMRETIGVWDGKLSPGMQTEIMSYVTGKGIDPTSKAFIDATEAVRGLLLAQEGAAGYGLLPAKTLKSTDTLEVIGPKITKDNARTVQSSLDEVYGKGNTIFVQNPDGFHILNINPEKITNTDFAKLLGEAKSKIENITGTTSEIRGMSRGKTSTDPALLNLGWEKGEVTKLVLEKIKKIPGLEKNANSPRMKKIVGELADYYSSVKAGKPNEKIIRVLKDWSEGGIPAVESLVKKGLAPAILLYLLPDLQNQSQGYLEPDSV